MPPERKKRGSKDEKAPLLSDKEPQPSHYGIFHRKGSEKGSHTAGDDAGRTKKISIRSMFRYADRVDAILLTVGTIAAVIHGAGFPALALVFGQMTRTFIRAAQQGFSPDGIVNSTAATAASDLVRRSTLTTATPSSGLYITPGNGSSTAGDSAFSAATVSAMGTTLEQLLAGTAAPGTISGEALTPQQFSVIMTWFSLIYVFIGIAVFVASVFQIAFWVISCERQMHRLRQEFFYQVMRMEISWFDFKQSGALTMKLNDDLERVREGMGDKFSMCIESLAAFASGLVVGFYTSWRLTLVVLACTPFLAGTSAYFGRMVANSTMREQQKYGAAGSVAEEILSCIRTVTAFGGQEKAVNKYNELLEAGRKTSQKKYTGISIAFLFIMFVIYGSYALAFWFGAEFVLWGYMDAGDVFTVFFSVMMGSTQLGNALPFVTVVATSQGAASTIYEVIDCHPKIDAYSKAGMQLSNPRGRVCFDKINFSYPSRQEIPAERKGLASILHKGAGSQKTSQMKKWERCHLSGPSVLQDVSFSLEQGETVAVVGSSGCGKSTLVNLLLRFYDPQSGRVTLDGVDIRDLNLAWLRSQIGVVSQEPILFDCSISENIEFGGDNVTMREIIKAAEAANAHNFIMGLPQGYSTNVGERGAQLSGGQKQRIAIARALVKDPKILILDEATSALDAESEGIVQEALDKASKGRTTLVIAHRLSTIQNADKIVAMENGLVKEIGTHDSLIEKRGVYFNLVTTQTFFDEDEETKAVDPSGTDSTAQTDGSMFYGQGRLKKYGHRRRRISDSMQSSFDWKRLETDISQRARDAQRRYSTSALSPTGDDVSKPLSPWGQTWTGSALEPYSPRQPDGEHFVFHQASPVKDRTPEEENFKPAGLLQVLPYAKPDSRWIALGTLGCAFSGIVMPVYAFLYSEIFNTFTLTGQALEEAAKFWSLMFLVLALFGGIGASIRTAGMGFAGDRMTTRMRLLCFKNIIRQPISWFDEETHSTGKLSTRLATDAPMVKAAAGHRLGIVMAAIITIIGALALAFVFGWKLALAISLASPVLVIAGYIQVRVQKVAQKKDAELMEAAGNVATQAIQNIGTVQALNRERTFFENYVLQLEEPFKEAKKQAYIYGLVYAFSQGVIFVIYAGAFRLGAYLVAIEDMTPTDVYRVFFAIAFCAVSVGQMNSYVSEYSKAKLSAGLLIGMIERQPEIDPYSKSGVRQPITGKVAFRDVHFSYPQRAQVPVLQGMNFVLNPGQSLALVGPSGCGKSTVVSLIQRFYDLHRGQVLVDDIDLRAFNLPYIRRQISVVSQEPVLFDCSIAENITYGLEDPELVPMDQIVEAAKSANIHDFIATLAEGYNTRVGDKGTQLSGGQKQRIAIARALIRDPKILLLDEATSALDTESEKIVQEAIDKARVGRTCIIVAHRLSTIQNADCIAVVDRGRIVESGTHNELRAKKGLYYKLIRRQQTAH